MKHYCVILLCLVLFSNVERMSAREIEYQNVVYEILDGCQARVMRTSPYKKLLHRYSGKVYIPDSIYIDNNAYYVVDVTDAFRACQYLREIHLPSGLTYIINSAFAYCSSLQHIELPDSVSRIYDNSFYSCPSLQSVKLSISLQRIGNSAFAECTRLKSIEIPQQVVTIEADAFAKCRNLKRVVISQNVESIGEYAFGECKRLREIYVYTKEPPKLGCGTTSLLVFEGVKRSIPIHIPKGSKPLYMQAKEWSLFTNYIDDL